VIKSYYITTDNLKAATKRMFLIAFLVFIHIFSYNFVGKNNIACNYAHYFITELDYILPFVPRMVWVYISTYFLILLAGAIIRDEKDLFRLIEAIFYTWILTYPFFYYFPAIYPRPNFEVVDLTTKMLKYNYQYDLSNNTFPSLHVSLSFVIAFAMQSLIRNKKKGLWLVWAVLVALSTVLVKKHFVIDIFGGVITAYVAYVLSFRLRIAEFTFGLIRKNLSKYHISKKKN
jgi:membrane-associated phospholipid phosphatase